MGAQKYRKKPVEVEAMQMPDHTDQTRMEDVRPVAEWMVDRGYDADDVVVMDTDPHYIYGDQLLPEYGVNYLEIETLEGTMIARENDYIVRGVQGEFYPVKPDIFEQTYEAVES